MATTERAVSGHQPDVPADRPAAGAEPVTAHRIAELIRDQVGIQVPDSSTDLLATGLIDSLSLVALFLALEQAFQFEVEMEDLELDDFRSTERIADYVNLRIGRSNPSQDG
jgi:acyl carrier protein